MRILLVSAPVVVFLNELPEFIAQYRFFNPIRYPSLGLAIIEAMMVGLPVVGLATTELVSVITSGVNGYLSLNLDELVEHTCRFCWTRLIWRAGWVRTYALDRFSIARFANG